MPYVNVRILKGATRKQKAQLVKEITDSLVRILNKNPEYTHIVIDDVAETNWAVGGRLTDERRRAAKKSSSR